MTVTKERAMQMFDRDLEILMDDLRGMQAHYQIADWEAFVFIRKPDCPESYVVKYAAADDALAKQIVQLHAATPPTTPSDAAMRAAEEVARAVSDYMRVRSESITAADLAATTSPETPVGGEERSHCETCRCGLTRIEWSDREGWVNLSKPESIADVVMNCALDHSYDRTGDGIPYGFPDVLRVALAPVVAKHLSVTEPDWQNKTVYMDLNDDNDSRRGRFRQELIVAATAALRTKEGESK